MTDSAATASGNGDAGPPGWTRRDAEFRAFTLWPNQLRILLPIPGRSHHIRNEAIQLVARIRIALPYRAATDADVRAVDAAIARLRANGCPATDEVMEELENFAALLEILVPPSERG